MVTDSEISGSAAPADIPLPGRAARLRAARETRPGRRMRLPVTESLLPNYDTVNLPLWFVIMMVMKLVSNSAAHRGGTVSKSLALSGLTLTDPDPRNRTVVVYASVEKNSGINMAGGPVAAGGFVRSSLWAQTEASGRGQEGARRGGSRAGICVTIWAWAWAGGGGGGRAAAASRGLRQRPDPTV
jgi:hypothetical protein